MTNLADPIFNDEDKARAHLESLRWEHGVYCPHCGNTDQQTLHKLAGKSTRPGLYQCNSCRQHFTVTVGTVMERSKIPLTKWVLGFHLYAASKTGLSAHQLHRMLGVTYKTAWFMAHRIREAMKEDVQSSGPIGGEGRPLRPTRPISASARRLASMLAFAPARTGSPPSPARLAALRSALSSVWSSAAERPACST
jgi:transposase-like protein